jgi:hypothetical protein
VDAAKPECHTVVLLCPDDCEHFFENVRRAIERTNRKLKEAGKPVHFQPRNWRDVVPVTDGHHPQKIINQELLNPSEWTVALCVMWNRFGTCTDTHASGTEEEIDLALMQVKASNGVKKLILAFSREPTDLATRDALEQKAQVLGFKDKWRKSGLYMEFTCPRQFEEEVHDHLFTVACSLASAAQMALQSVPAGQTGKNGASVTVPAGTVAVACRYGEVWSGLIPLLQSQRYDYDFVDGRITKDDLFAADALIIPGSGYRRIATFDREELQAIEEFVAGGGGLLCAGQAWSWADKRYGNKPVEAFPLNLLGKQFGFTITETYVHQPTPSNCDEETRSIFAGKYRRQWSPSAVQLARPDSAILKLRDDAGRLLAATYPHQKGHVAVGGSEDLYRDNPGYLALVLKTLVKMWKA